MINELFNHLWQSTVFAAAVALAALALRRNSPRLRYWIWLAASIKFLVPFSWMVSVGARIHLPPDTPSFHAVTVQQISTTFAPVSVAAETSHTTPEWPLTLAAIWAAGVLFLVFRWSRRWRTIHLAARRATPLPLPHPVPVFKSPSTLEPGIFGIFRPILLLPEGIADKLSPEQFEAVLRHELRHIRYRDNLTAALHMCVETLFWFHPIVWWIGARLTAERERDCDEAVLAQGSQPGDYARGIVQVCEAYAESPLPCASGITGSDLKKRIREIMTWRCSPPLSFGGRAALAVAGAAAVTIPLVIGVIRAQTLPPPPAYGYEVAAIHKAAPGQTGGQIGPGPQGGWRVQNMSTLSLIEVAYTAQAYQILGAPGWVSSDYFDILFTPDKAESAPGAAPGPKELQEIHASMGRNAQRLQEVLRDRFGLVLRTENRELPTYNLIQTKTGHKLQPHDPGKRSSIGENDRQITVTGDTVGILAQMLSGIFGRPVHDGTGLTGQYDYKLDWTPDTQPSDASGNNALGPSIFTSLTDQLGLRLESTKGPVQVYVIEKIEHPSEN